MCGAFPRTGVSAKYSSALITVLLFYVVIMRCNEQVAVEMRHNHGDGDFIMKTWHLMDRPSLEGGYVRMISCGEIICDAVWLWC